MKVLKKVPGFFKKSVCILLALILATGGVQNVSADLEHDELKFNATVKAKRSTITINPNGGYIRNPASGDINGQTGQFTITGKINTSVTIGAGSNDAAHLSSLQESDTGFVNLQGFTYTFGAKDETITAKWKNYKTYFNGNGGTSGATEKSTEYQHKNTMPNATRTNYTFNGWYTATSGGTRVGGNGTQYTQTGTQPTYYAQWACNHPGTKAVNKNDATYHRLVCNQCGVTRNENVAHGYGGWTQHDGTNHKRTCGACGYVQYAGHGYGAWAQHDGTNHKRTCSTCGYVQYAGHSYGAWAQHDGTNHKRTCTVCGYVQYAGHGYGAWAKHDKTNHKRTCSTCGYVQYSAHTYGKWTKHNATQHKRTCSACSYVQYANHADANHDGKCDTCSAAFTTGTITLHWIKSTPSGDYDKAFNTVKSAGTSSPKKGSSTYWPVSDDPSPGAYYIKKSGGGTHYKHTFVGWSKSNNNKWDDNWSSVTKNPSEYSNVAAAAKDGYTGTLHAVYKYSRNSKTYYVCAE